MSFFHKVEHQFLFQLHHWKSLLYKDGQCGNWCRRILCILHCCIAFFLWLFYMTLTFSVVCIWVINFNSISNCFGKFMPRGLSCTCVYLLFLIEPRSPRPLMNTLFIRPMVWSSQLYMWTSFGENWFSNFCVYKICSYSSFVLYTLYK